MKTLALFLAGTWIVAAAAAAENPVPAAAPTPEATPAPEAANHPFSLNLHRIAAGDDRTGHAEFNLDIRREFWIDPMIRLSFALDREQVAARSSGTFGFPTQAVAGPAPLIIPSADPRMVLQGPWAADWHDLTTGEKIGRATETAVTYGIIFEILRSLHK